MSKGASRGVTLGTLLGRRRERGSENDALLSVTQDKGVIPQDEAGRRNVSSADKTTYWRVYPDDIVYNTMRMWQGASARSDHFGIVSPAYTVCCPASGVSSRFLSYALKLREHIKVFRARSQGLTSDVWSLRFEELARIELQFVPGYAQQERIVEILSSVDDAIENTQAVIDQVQVVKRGLMQELLTRGLRNGSGGQTEWSEESLGNLFTLQLGKMLNRKARETLPKFPYLGNRDVQWGRFDFSELREMHFNEKEREKFSLILGDLLVCEGGEIGRTAIWTDEVDCYYQKAIHRLRVRDQGRVEPRFILHFMRFAGVNGLFTDLTSQSSIAHLTREKLALLRVPLPPLPEQRKIAAILSSVDDYTTQTEGMIRQAQAMKQDLMAVLLTGELRVTSDTEAA